MAKRGKLTEAEEAEEEARNQKLMAVELRAMSQRLRGSKPTT